MSKPLAWINAITGDVTTVDCSDTLLWAPLYLATPKQEPLSGEERYGMYIASRATSIDAYTIGFRDAEKAHGIGVDDDN